MTVGIVFVSHSTKIAEGLIDLARQMAHDVEIQSAGGTDDGGIGIHGEPGRERIPLEPADAIVDRLLAPILEDLPFDGGDRVLLFVNGMGGTPQVELYIVFRRAAEALRERGIEVARSLVGNYVTSLEMQGVSITLLKLDDEFVELWDAPVNTISLRWGR